MYGNKNYFSINWILSNPNPCYYSWLHIGILLSIRNPDTNPYMNGSSLVTTRMNRAQKGGAPSLAEKVMF